MNSKNNKYIDNNFGNGKSLANGKFILPIIFYIFIFFV